MKPLLSLASGRASVGLPLVLVFAVLAVTGPWLSPYPPRAIDLAHELAEPSRLHWLGTADNGVDVLSVLLHGARLAGVVSLAVVSVSLAIGAALGALAGYAGGRIDQVVTRITDATQAMPGLVINIALLALLARPGLEHLVLALCATGWVPYARVARAEALRLRDREFVTAARALGAPATRIVVRHVLPNALGPLVVQATFGLGGAVLAEASLSFLGLGPGAVASWGALLDQGTAHLLREPRLALVSGAAIAIAVLGFNLTGDWLRDVLDPRERATE
jgi:peptide/nickel transport system permease protein